MKSGIAIAIDGPAGSGKSTIAKAVAAKFNYIYIDTGAMYRAVTLKALRDKLSFQDEPALTAMAESTQISLEYLSNNGEVKLQVYLDGNEVTEEIRSLEVTNNVSVVAAVAGVRAALVKIQQQIAGNTGVVMDGRDIGTVVLPQAELKIFLTASVAERSKRRWLELQTKGVKIPITELEDQIKKRDFIDSNREVNPLRQANDAILLDTSNLSIEAVVNRVVALALEKGAVPKA